MHHSQGGGGRGPCPDLERIRTLRIRTWTLGPENPDPGSEFCFRAETDSDLALTLEFGLGPKVRKIWTLGPNLFLAENLIWTWL